MRCAFQCGFVSFLASSIFLFGEWKNWYTVPLSVAWCPTMLARIHSEVRHARVEP